MRTRLVHPEFFTDERIAKLSDSTRLIFAGLWLLADRAGLIADSPKMIDGTLFPHKTRPSNCSVSRALSELAEAGRIVRYEANGEHYLKIVNFLKHQHIHPREKPSKLPGPDTTLAGENNGRDPSASTSTSTSRPSGEERAPEGRASDPNERAGQVHRRRHAPDGRAGRAASATVTDQTKKKDSDVVRRIMG